MPLKSRMVELVSGYSKLPSLALTIRKLQTQSSEKPSIKLSRRKRLHLTETELTDLVRAYKAGASTRALAQHYGVGKTKITEFLQDQHVVLRNQGLSQIQVTDAADLYTAGKSVAQVAAAMGLSISSIYDALTRAGVQMRPAHEVGRRGSRPTSA